MAVEETGRGLVEDKATKNIFACEHVTNYLAGQKTVGIIREDDVMGIDEIAEPVGVVAGVTPVTNPTSTAIFKSLIALRPAARSSSASTRAHRSAPSKPPRSCATQPSRQALLRTVSSGSSTRPSKPPALMKHDGIATILATGGPGMVKAAYSSGKPALASALATLRHMSTRTSTSCAPPTIWCSPSTSITA